MAVFLFLLLLHDMIATLCGSNSSKSINKRLLDSITLLIGDKIPHIDLNFMEYPMYSIDLEEKIGIPSEIMDLAQQLSKYRGLVIAVNEHNGSISAHFKNILDWLSRADRNYLADKKVLLLSTSPGTRGGSRALEYMKGTLPHFGATVVESFSFPSFYDNFDLQSNTINNKLLLMGVNGVLATFLETLNS